MRHVQSQRLERWLGTERVEALSQSFRDWYGPPVRLLDVPGSVSVHGGGDFTGPFERGYFASALDSLAEILQRATRFPHGQLNSGFTSISDALSRASTGKLRSPGGGIFKAGSTGVAAVSNTLWRVGNQPAGGAAGSAAPDGRATDSSTTGAMAYDNPASGTMHLVGADMLSSVINNSLLLYDRLFDVAKTMSSSATESVTGVPTRYQSSTTTAEDYAGGNFIFIEVVTALSNTAHNWTTCLYRNQAGTDAQTLPSVTGNNSAIQDRLDQPTGTWFCPLATGDTGAMDLNQMQCSSNSLTGAINFCIGHPLGIMGFPVSNCMIPFDWLTNRNQAPRVFDDACLSLLELPKPSTTATNYTGQIYLCSAAA